MEILKTKHCVILNPQEDIETIITTNKKQEIERFTGVILQDIGYLKIHMPRYSKPQ